MENTPGQSPFYDDIADIQERERWKLYAREYYDQVSRLRNDAYSGHVEYGKWLIASVLAVHGGAVYAISGLRDPSKPQQLAGLLTSVELNIAGVFLILVAGFCAWLNFQIAYTKAANCANPSILYRRDKFPKQTNSTAVNVTLYLAASAGILSALCFVGSAWFVFLALKGP